MKLFIPIFAVLSANAFAMGPAPLQAEQVVIHQTARGEVYVADSSFPVLGEAYRDPHGLIWGSIVKDEKGQALKATEAEAEAYCLSLNEAGYSPMIRLPSAEEFKNLRSDLGGEPGIEDQFSPYAKDASILSALNAKVQVLPDLAGNFFWSSSVNAEDSAALSDTLAEDDLMIGKIGYVFSGDNTDFTHKVAKSNPMSAAQMLTMSFRCVGRRN